MPTAQDIFWVVAVPLVLSLVAMAAGRGWRRGRGVGGWAAAIAVAGSYAAAFHHLDGGAPDFPPASGTQWVFWLTVPVIVVALLQAFVRHNAFAVVASALVLLATPFLVLKNRQAALDAPVFWGWVIGAGVAMVAWWLATEMLARRTRGATLPALLMVVTGVSALAVTNASSQKLGMATGSISVALFVVAAAGWRTGRTVLPRGGALAVAVLLLALLLASHHLADLSIRDLALLALAPLAAWAGEFPGLGERDSRRRVIFRTVAVLLILALPAVTALSGLRKTLQDQTESYDYM